MANNNSSGGVGFFGLMFLIFMTLKLIEVINWSWLWAILLLKYGGTDYIRTKNENDIKK
jgi:hypothetical protein